jgi:hypothetical protein
MTSVIRLRTRENPTRRLFVARAFWTVVIAFLDTDVES